MRDWVRENADADDALEIELPVLVRQSLLGMCPGRVRGLFQDVGGAVRELLGSMPNSSIRLSGMCPP